jgi:hypothetical protein
MFVRTLSGVSLRSNAREFHPLAFLGALVVKKAFVYSALSKYGFPRVYRRLLEQNRLNVALEHQPTVKRSIERIFRSPTELFTAALDSQTAAFLRTVIKNKSTNLPPALLTVAEQVLESSPAGKVVKELEKHRKK